MSGEPEIGASQEKPEHRGGQGEKLVTLCIELFLKLALHGVCYKGQKPIPKQNSINIQVLDSLFNLLVFQSQPHIFLEPPLESSTQCWKWESVPLDQCWISLISCLIEATLSQNQLAKAVGQKGRSVVGPVHLLLRQARVHYYLRPNRHSLGRWLEPRALEGTLAQTARWNPSRKSMWLYLVEQALREEEVVTGDEPESTLPEIVRRSGSPKSQYLDICCNRR